MKNHMMKLIIGIGLIIVIGGIIYMRSTCTGLWEKKVSKIPFNLLDSSEEPIYVRCDYIGLSGIFDMKKSVSEPISEPKISLARYKNDDPDFSFNYPQWSAYKITVTPNSIEYSIESELDGPTDASIQWDKIFIKTTADYWDNKKINKNGVRYVLSETEKFLDFRLENQGGAVISFDVSLPGSYLRKKEIINTLIDSFKEEK